MYKKKWKRNMAVFMAGVMVSSQIMVPVSAKENSTATSKVAQEDRTTNEKESDKKKDEDSNEEKKTTKKSSNEKADSNKERETSTKEKTKKEEVVYVNLNGEGKREGV